MDCKGSDTRIPRRAVGKPVTFTFDGKPVSAHTGESIGVALHANGYRMISRSFKFHRPRGLMCVDGKCPNCLVRVNGIPNIRACEEPAADGLHVESQNAWPTLATDAGAVLGSMDFLFPAGFQYKKFLRPKFLRGTYENIIRHVAGIGEFPVLATNHNDSFVKQKFTVDVLVLGGGPAGCLAALEAARAGASVALVNKHKTLCENLQVHSMPLTDKGLYAGKGGHEVAADLRRRVAEAEMVRVFVDLQAVAYYPEDRMIVATNNKILVKFMPKIIIVATGYHDMPPYFANSDLPGIFPLTGFLRLMNLYGVKPGNRLVLLTRNSIGYHAARQARDNHIDVTRIVDERGRGEESGDRQPVNGISVVYGETIDFAGGGKNGVSWVSVTDGHKSERITCDSVCVSGAFYPANEFLFHAGLKLSYSEYSNGYVPSFDENMKVANGFFVAGCAAGLGDLNHALTEGQAAGFSAAAELGLNVNNQTHKSQVFSKTRAEGLDA